MTFHSDWASPPGELIKEVREELKLSLEHFAEVTGLTTEQVFELEVGKYEITEDLAERLECNLGHSARFWLRLEENYQSDLKRLSKRFPNVY